MKFKTFIFSLVDFCLVLGISTYSHAQYPGNCATEITVNHKWHYEVYPTIPKHYFPTEENPLSITICQPTRTIDSSGQYIPNYLSCDQRTVTSGEYWGQWPEVDRSIKLYYYEDNVGWVLSDKFNLSPPCPPFSNYYCSGILMVYFSNEDKNYLDSLPTALPPGCPELQQEILQNLGEPQGDCQ